MKDKIKSFWTRLTRFTRLKSEGLAVQSCQSCESCPRAVALAFCLLAALPAASHGQPRKSGAPEANLPRGFTQLTAFGERPAWSPDGTRIAFIGKGGGDAYEIDVRTRLVRHLTGHFAHPGFLRVQFLQNGDYLLTGFRAPRDVQAARYREAEMWVMKGDLSGPALPLGAKVHEGVAVSAKRMRIAWSQTWLHHPETLPPEESALYVADVVWERGAPALAGRREVLRARQPDCTIEAQDFRLDDQHVVYSCYRENGNKADVMGVDLRTRQVTAFRKIAGEYNEAEGVSPDGRYVYVESSHDQGPAERQTFKYLDIWRLRLAPNGTDFVRITRFGEYEGRKATNPVVSPDGKWMAFQAGRSSDPPGVGYGIFIYKLPSK